METMNPHSAEAYVTEAFAVEESTTQWSFDIPIENASVVRAKIGTLIRRAAKLSVELPTIIEGEPFEVKKVTVPGGKVYYATYINFTVVQPKPVSLDGWTFIATIEHGDDGEGKALNVIRSVPNAATVIPKEYRQQGATCDHCRSKRRRTETFVVEHVDGKLSRVGRNCIRDFLGGESAEAILAMESYLRQINAALEDGEGGSYGAKEWRFGAVDVLAFASTAIREYGWLSRGNARKSDWLKRCDAYCDCLLQIRKLA